MVGTTVGRYRIDALLGRGGMGEVYRAYDPELGRAVALKLVRWELAEDDSGGVDRFLREARAASALNHPGIITIHEVGRLEDDRRYIVQEFVDGQTVRALIAGKPLPITTIANIGRQVARALGAAHAAGIVHRDIKPENVMIRPDGYVKVLDFGLARVSADSATTTVLSLQTTAPQTGANTLVGTVSYVSPEQVGGKPARPASDIFALGVMLYEMGCGRRPFAEASYWATLNAIATSHPPAPSRLTPSLPTAFDTLVLRMLAKDPDHRPTAAQVDACLVELASDSAPVPIGTPPVRRETVGRASERDVLARAFESATAGTGGVVAVAGEPGIGKTSIVEDVVNDFLRSGHDPVVARGRCSERLAGTEAYLPLLETLDTILHGDSAASRGSFADMMRSVAPTWYVHVAPQSGETTVVEQAQEAARGASQERMKRELDAFFHEVSRVRPLVLFIDDLHWADVSTIDFLSYLAARVRDRRVLVLLTYRPSDLLLAKHPFVHVRAELHSRQQLQEIVLGFLGIDDVERYLSLRYPGHDFPPAFTELIYGKTEGAPLFMVDLLRYLEDRGVIAQSGQRWTLPRSLPEIATELPESVRNTIARTIDRLDAADRRLLVAAAVQGHEFDTAIVADASASDPADVEERLDELGRVHGLIRAIGPVDLPDRTLSVRYRFVHVLYQNVLYASLQPTRRAVLSGQVAASLLRHHGTRAAAIASELAYLFDAARQYAEATRYFLIAAQHAARLYAFREAVALCQRGLSLIPAQTEGPERLQTELGLQLVLGLGRRTLEGWAVPEVEPIYTRARQICQQLGDAPELLPVLWGLTLFHAIRGDLRTMEAMSALILQQAETSGDRAHLVAAHQMRASVNEFLGNTIASSEYSERAVAGYDQAQHQMLMESFGLDPGLIAWSLSPRALWFTGHSDQALARVTEAVALGRRFRDPISTVFALCLASNIYMLRRDPEPAIAAADEEIRLCREYGLAQEVEWGRCFRAASLMYVGRIDESVAELRDSLHQQRRMSAGLLRTMNLSFLAEALWHAERPDEGLAALDEAVAYGEQSLERFYFAEIDRVRGDLLRQRGDRDAARAAYERALSRAAAQGALAFELRAAIGLARMFDEDGDRARAVAIVSPIYARFTEGRGTGDLNDAAAILSTDH
jgi:tetratricopeptide (TPR) repeat protein